MMLYFFSLFQVFNLFPHAQDHQIWNFRGYMGTLKSPKKLKMTDNGIEKWPKTANFCLNTYQRKNWPKTATFIFFMVEHFEI